MQTEQMPTSIERFVRGYLRQRNRMLFWRALLTAFVILMGWIALWCLADRALHFPVAVRLVVLMVTVLGAGLWLLAVLRGTLLAKIDTSNAAMELEHLRPDLDERLATLCSRMVDTNTASPALLDAIAHQVESCIGEKGVPRMLSLRTIGGHVAGAAAMVVCIAAIWLIPIVGLPSLMFRFFVPWADSPPVSTTRLLLQFDPAALDLKENESTILHVLAVRPGEEGVTMHYSSDGKTWDARSMTCVGPGQYLAGAGPIYHDEQFYLTSGDYRSPVMDLRALRRPAITEFRVRYEYPSYMKREPFIARNVDGLIEAPVGTRATVQIVATEPLASARLEARDFSLPLTTTIERTVMETAFAIEKDQPYSITMTSTKGLEGKSVDGAQIRAIPDRPPFVQLVAPSDDIRLSPRDIATIRFQALDDYGLDSVSIRVRVNDAQAVDLPTAALRDPRRRDGEQALDLANLGLKIGDVVAVNVVAVDGAKQETQSPTRHLFASPHSVDTADYTRLSELQRSHEAVREMNKDLKSAVEALDRARRLREKPAEYELADTAYQQHVADTGRDAEELRHSLSRALARSTDEKLNDLLASFADRAEVRMIEAHDLIDELGQGDARELNARQRLERAQEQMRPIEQQLKQLAESALAEAALADQQNLAAAAQVQASGQASAQAAEMLSRMRQDVADQIRQLGLNPEDPNTPKHLETKIKTGERALADAKPLNLSEPAQSWADQLLDEKIHAPMFDRRLAAAADVESLRGDGNLQRASDLNLASRAATGIWLLAQDPEGKPTADQARQEFVKSFQELERQHAQGEISEDQARAMAEARDRLARWAGDTDQLTGPAVPDEAGQRELALQANEHMANRRYDRASEIQRRMAMEQQQALEAADAMREAEEIDALAESQESLRRQLLASGDEAAALAERQRAVAERIGQQIEDGRADVPGAPRDSRRDALAAIQAVQERLARMPQQLQEAVQAADVQFQANDIAQRLTRDAQSAAPDRKAAAERAAERANVAVTDARRQTEESVLVVDPDVVRVMTSALQEYFPETVSATRVLESKLSPSLQTFKQSASANQAAELVRSARLARDAIAEAQKELRGAQQALMDQDPLFAARMYADAAAAALSRVPPDVEGALQNQQMAHDQLSRQWSTSVHEAAAAHLSGLARFRSVYDEQTQRKFASESLARSREWGVLRDRETTEFTATSRDDDPSGYQRMLQAYFRTLGRAGEQEKK